jgi:hypothetical protein
MIDSIDLTYSKEDIGNVHRDENSITNISQIQWIRPSNQPKSNDMLPISQPLLSFKKGTYVGNELFEVFPWFLDPSGK